MLSLTDICALIRKPLCYVSCGRIRACSNLKKNQQTFFLQMNVYIAKQNGLRQVGNVKNAHSIYATQWIKLSRLMEFNGNHHANIVTGCWVLLNFQVAFGYFTVFKSIKLKKIACCWLLNNKKIKEENFVHLFSLN